MQTSPLNSKVMFDIKNTNGACKRVLIIDDDVDLVNSLKELIQSEGFEVDTASDGNIGIKMQISKPYNLVVTDIIMPTEDGLEVIMHIKKMFPQTMLMAMSGGGLVHSNDYLLMAKELGASTVLSKPFDIGFFKSEVHRLASR